MKKIKIILPLFAVSVLVACNNGKPGAEEELKNQIKAAEISIDSINDAIHQAKVRLDSIKTAVYPTPGAKQTAVDEARQMIEGTQSVLENAKQKFEAAKQSFKDATGKVYESVINTVGDEAEKVADNVAAETVVDAVQTAASAGQTAKRVAKDVSGAATAGVKQTVGNTKTAVEAAAGRQIRNIKKKADEKANKAADKARKTVDRAH